MTLFKLITIFHLICCLTLTISIQLSWKISLYKDKKIDLSYICSSFIGCKQYTKAQICKERQHLCTGSNRCCKDCKEAWQQSIFNSSLGRHLYDSNRTSHIHFDDEFAFPVRACLIGSCAIFLLHIVLLILLSIKHTNYNLEQKSRSTHKKLGVIHKITSCVLLLIIFILSIGLFLYSLGYIIVNIYSLLNCQIIFITLISWSWILFLCFFNFIFDTMPYAKKKCVQIHHEGEKKLRAIFQQKVLKLCFQPLYICFNLLNYIAFFWWIGIGIYIIGSSYEH